MTRFATVDIGSNSVLLYVAERRAGGLFHPVMERLDVSRLGEGLRDTGSFSEQAMARTMGAICEFKRLAQEHGAAHLAAVGTMAMRSAANSEEFISMVHERCGVQIEVISGKKEAYLAYLGAIDVLSTSKEPLVVLDVGGGSTEVIHGSGGEMDQSYSLNVGALHLTEKHLMHDPPMPGELDALRREVQWSLSKIRKQDAGTRLVGVGGTITTLSAVKLGMQTYDSALVHGSTIDSAEVKAQLQRYSSLSLEHRCELPGLQPNRADIILAGALIVSELMDRLGLFDLLVSNRGVRHGLMMERFA